MTPLRDSNPVFSAGWRILARWFGTGGPGWLPHPLSSTGRKVTARSYLKLLNFKANHRKLVVTEKECLVGSANPHDASAFHSNIAFAGSGRVCGDLLESEKAAAALSGVSVARWPAYAVGGEDGGVSPPSGDGGGDDTPRPGHVQVVTEGKIFDALMEELRASEAGDQVDLAMFYLSERRVVGALLEAAARGAAVRLVLDPNKDAFGREKGGIPNRQVARELFHRSEGQIRVRWYDTHGEQFHTKLMVVTRGNQVAVLGGSANLTRRNLRDFNLETDLRFRLPADAPLALAVREYFDRIFTNRDAEYTAPFEMYRNESRVKSIIYRLRESTGFSSF
jgi:phosphatidylserine/phosphatidylglycerophosphate/cardiolipin synthase-like enzyme